MLEINYFPTFWKTASSLGNYTLIFSIIFTKLSESPEKFLSKLSPWKDLVALQKGLWFFHQMSVVHSNLHITSSIKTVCYAASTAVNLPVISTKLAVCCSRGLLFSSTAVCHLRKKLSVISLSCLHIVCTNSRPYPPCFIVYIHVHKHNPPYSKLFDVFTKIIPVHRHAIYGIVL